MYIKYLAKTVQYLSARYDNKDFIPGRTEWIVDRTERKSTRNSTATLYFVPAPLPIKLHIVTLLRNQYGLVLIDPMRTRGGVVILNADKEYTQLGRFMGARYTVTVKVRPPYKQDTVGYIEPLYCVSLAKRVSATVGEDIITPMHLLRALWNDREILGE